MYDISRLLCPGGLAGSGAEYPRLADRACDDRHRRFLVLGLVENPRSEILIYTFAATVARVFIASLA
jgi:hypothetical protein